MCGTLLAMKLKPRTVVGRERRRAFIVTPDLEVVLRKGEDCKSAKTIDGMSKTKWPRISRNRE